ncbi:ATP-binding protein [Lachnospiraceae bacterium 47-T17]
MKQTMDAENILLEQDKVIDFLLKSSDLSRYDEVFADVTIASVILDRVLHYCTVVSIKGASYRLKERKEFMRQKQQIVNTLFGQRNT